MISYILLEKEWLIVRYYVDKDTLDFFEQDVEAIIELLKKAYISTKEYYINNKSEDFLYFSTYKTFMNGYCFYFVRLLKSIYKNATFVVRDKNYAHISHIFIKIDGEIYDIYGKRNLKEYYELTNADTEMIALNHKIVNEDVYKTFKKYFYEYLDLYIEYNKKFIKYYKKDSFKRK